LKKARSEFAIEVNRRALIAAAPLKGWLYQWLLGMLLVSGAAAHGESAAEAWVRRYSNQLGGGNDSARKIVTDAEGNVIVAGNSDNGVVDGVVPVDMLIIKYSGAGIPLWTNRYNGLATSYNFDFANALAVDSSGNVLVTGYSHADESDYDYLTIKYSSAGIPLWTNRYNGPANSYDRANAIAVDSKGSVFVTGSSYGDFSDYDYATIKYSAAGVLLWVRRYNGPGTREDQAIAIAVDSAGNALVTGYSDSGGSRYDYATIKYSGAGVPLWTNRYNGPLGYNDYASALAVDSNGSVFVTGYSLVSVQSYAYATIAYSGTGLPLWTNRYNEGYDNQASAIAVDSSGRVFVTGYSVGSGSSEDYATIAYSGAGLPLWTNRYNSPVNSSDKAKAITVDRAGNVLVTGCSGSRSAYPYDYDYATIKYSVEGLPLWTNRYTGPGKLGSNGDVAQDITVDSDGNVFVTGYSDSNGSSLDYATLAYSSAGWPLWTNRFDGPANRTDSPNGIAVDSSGIVFVVGSSVGIGGSYDYATIAYSRLGVPLWTNRYDGGSNADDAPQAVATDSSGNVFVTGYSVVSGQSHAYATVAYSGTGLLLWTNRYNGMGYDNQSSAMAVDSSGNVFVTGYSYQSLGSDPDYATIAYSGSGVPLWTNRYDGPTNGADFPTAIAVDSTGDVLVTGFSSTSQGSQDYATIKYSGGGVPLWTNRYNGPGNGSDQARAIAVDSAGNAFVTGSSLGCGYATVKYSGAGMLLWINCYSGPNTSGDHASAIAVDSDGNVFVTGSSFYDFATIKYSGAGVPLWTNRYHEPTGNTAQATAIAVDSRGNVFVTGYSVMTGGFYDYTTIEYSGAGVPFWTNHYNGPGNASDKPGKNCLALGPGGAVYVTGASVGEYSGIDYATVKYVIQPKLAIRPFKAGVAEVNLLLTGAPDSEWFVERALLIKGPWTNIGPVTIQSTGSAPFQDTGQPNSAAFYRALLPY
jgi:uncharacterized delta-60 repeat protein